MSRDERQKKRLNEYRKIKRRWRQYNAKALIESTRSYLYELLNSDDGRLRFLSGAPWVMFLLIKWIYEDGAAKFNSGKIPTPKESHRLREEAFKLTNFFLRPSDFTSTHMFMRAIAHQQFPYQVDLNRNDLGRQWLIFACLEDVNPIKEQFRNEIGIDIETFLQFSYCLQAAWMSGKDSVTKTWLNSVESLAPDGDSEIYLASLSKTHQELRAFFRSQSYRGDEEGFEQTRLFEFPLLRKGDHYYCWNPYIYGNAIKLFIYRKLREANASVFMNTFGGVFEDYCRSAIMDSGVEFVGEEAIESTYPKKSKDQLIDFLISEKDAMILIDAKGVELKTRSMVGTDMGVLTNDIAASLIKVVSQAHDVYKNRSMIAERLGIDIADKEPFVIAVTYHEMYLKGGENLYKNVDKKELDEILQKHSDNAISLANIHFMSIDSFDMLCEWRRTTGDNIGDFLRQVTANNANPAKSTFSIDMELRKAGIQEIDRLVDATEQLEAPIEKMLMAIDDVET